MINKFKYTVIVILHFNYNIEQKPISLGSAANSRVHLLVKLVGSSALHVVGFYYIVFSFYY